MMKTAVAIRHVHFEDLGTFEAILASAGYRLYYYDIGEHEIWTLDPLLPDLLVILGGPIGVGDIGDYPFLVDELHILEVRLGARLPTLGICLGAQLMASALGAEVAPMDAREIGIHELDISDVGRLGVFRHLEGVPVLHWHGDAFELPEGAISLASTRTCAHQAFALGPNILALQFHPEVKDVDSFEQWLVGHACELTTCKVSPVVLRDAAALNLTRLAEAGRAMFSEWLAELR